MNTKQRRVEMKHRKKKLRHRDQRKEQAQATGAAAPRPPARRA